MKKIGLIKAIKMAGKYKKLDETERANLVNGRLHDLVGYVKENSPYFKELYANVSEDFKLEDLPITNKQQMMDNFSDWVTDREIDINEIKKFMENPDNIGTKYKGKYLIYTTSGSTGQPVIVIYDESTKNVITSVEILRSYARKQDLKKFMMSGGKSIGVFVTDGFYLGYGSVVNIQKTMPWKKGKIKVTSVYKPINEIVEELNKFKPKMLGGYPTALELLLKEKEEGRLNISPVIIMTGGEHLTDKLREKLTKAFNCYVQTNYSCTEGGAIACECEEKHFHLNDDWCIIEAVDVNNQPVGFGKMADKILLTNLANRTQPFIRYEITDRVIVHEEKCKCGNISRYIDLEGRTNETLSFETENGEQKIVPLAISSIVEEIEDIRSFQIVKHKGNNLEIRFICDGEKEIVFNKVEKSLIEYFKTRGITEITISQSDKEPERTLRSGKFKRVYTEEN